MKTVSIDFKRPYTYWLLGWAALVCTGGVGELTAQESDMTWVAAKKARIGVMLEELCEAPATVQSRCNRPPIVTSVVVDGPADLAGVRTSDTLLSVNGLDVTTAAGRALLLDLEAGVPVTLQVGRESGRATIDVTPELRSVEPYVDVRTMFFGSPDAVAEGTQARVQVVRIPSVQRRLDEVEVSLDSLRAGGNEFVFFHEDSDGNLKIEVGDPERANVILRRIREHAANPDGEGLSVWENENLARRLTWVRDSSFQSARVHLDSLVRLRGQFRVLRGDSLGVSVSVTSESDPDGHWAYYVRHRALPDELRTLLSSDLRVGGAEFRQLSGDLAEYFEGADEGLLVLRVIRDTPAHRMGLKEGDVVVEVEGRKCSGIEVLRDAIASASPRQAIQVKWIRKGDMHSGNLDPR
jgi:membrane-associated protease RseP (regulator of RpoE activity)